MVVNTQFGDVTAFAGIALAATAVARMRAIESLKQTLVSEANAVRHTGLESLDIESVSGGPAGDVVFVLSDGQEAIFVRNELGMLTPTNPAAVAISSRVLQQYAYQKYVKELRNEGYAVVKETVDESGIIHVVARRWRKAKEELNATVTYDGKLSVTHGDSTPWTEEMVETAELIGVRLGVVEAHVRDQLQLRQHAHIHGTARVHR